MNEKTKIVVIFSSVAVIAAIMFFAITAREDPRQDEHPPKPIYQGIPQGADPVCSWHIVNSNEGTCIADQRRYFCVRDGNTIACTQNGFDLIQHALGQGR